MSDSDSSFANFGKLVPGFDFLQNLGKQAAGSAATAMPQLASWVAPTVSVEELDKRIQELKTVQFWLDQNATALKATIQALEVQKMTLATLKGMNVAMGDVASAFSFKPADAKPGDARPAAGSDTGPAHRFAGLEVPASSFGSGSAPPPEAAAEAAANAPGQAPNLAPAPGTPGVIDPMQWWGALTQQFQTIASDAMKEVAKKAAINSHRAPATGPLEGAMQAATDAASAMSKNMHAGIAKVAGAQRSASTALRTGGAWPTPAAGKETPAGRSGSAAGPGANAAKAASTGSKAGTAAKTAVKRAAKTTLKKLAAKNPGGKDRK